MTAPKIDELIESYYAGNRESAWTELSSIRLSTLDSDSLRKLMDFARSVIAAFASNVYTLRDRLSSHGYKFHFGEDAVIPATPETLESLDRTERVIGKVPLVLRCFYEVFRKISFNQDARQTLDPQSPFAHYGFYSFFVVNPPEYALDQWESMKEKNVNPKVLNSLGMTEPLPTERLFVTGLAHPSEPAGIKVPADFIDCEYYFDHDRQFRVLFLEELRMNIKFAGFKGFHCLEINDSKRLFAEELARELTPF